MSLYKFKIHRTSSKFVVQGQHSFSLYNLKINCTRSKFIVQVQSSLFKCKIHCTSSRAFTYFEYSTLVRGELGEFHWGWGCGSSLDSQKSPEKFRCLLLNSQKSPEKVISVCLL